MTTVVDASVVVAWLVTGGPTGTWAEEVIGAGNLAAPDHLPVEVANVLRRAEHHGRIGPETAALAHRDLLDLTVDLAPYALVGERTWALRSTLTAYDAAYVALAEALDAPLATLDRRLARAPGPACTFHLPD